MTLELREIKGVTEIDPVCWDVLVDRDYPFLRHAFLYALEQSGDVSADTGWVPRHVTLWQSGRLVGFLVHYDKYHSWGEYVFDWQWADVWEQAGQAYYPKLLSAVPYTPSQGPRLVLAEGIDPHVARVLVADHLQRADRSGAHLLFPEGEEAACWQAAWPSLLLRLGVQYHWQDRDYGTFDDFLATLTSKRRKEVRRERRKVAEQGITLHWIEGESLEQASLEHFYRCYRMTYLERGQTPYLSLDFFERLMKTLPDNIVLMQARVDGQPIAAALYLKGVDTLYGRYWGSEVHADCLHFEACYYQGIDYCLAHGLSRFDPGTQGEHKLVRGFEPVLTRSLHWLKDSRFHQAVGDFLSRERPAVEQRVALAREALPFRQTGDN